MSKSKVTRRRVLQGAATVAAASVIPGFVRKAAGQTLQPAPDQSLVTMTITMSASGKGWVGTNFIGVSYPKDWLTNVGFVAGGTTNTRLFDPSNTSLMNFFLTANIQSLRFADSSNKVWDATGAGFVPTQISENDIEPLGKFLSATAMNVTTPPYRCECLYSVNLEGALLDPNVTPITNPAGTKITSPTLAYDEVTFAAGSTGLSTWIGGVEIGNEINSYGSSSGSESLTYTSGGTAYNWKLTAAPPPAYLSTLELAWEAFRDAIKASPNQNVVITGPAFDYANVTQYYESLGLSGGKYGAWDPTQFATDEFGKSKLDVLTQHYYTGDGHTTDNTAGYTPPSWYGANNTLKTPEMQPGLLLPSCNAQSWTNPGTMSPQSLYLANYLLPALQTAKGTTHTYRMSECNSYSNNGASGYSDAYGSALWAIDFMFTCAQYGASGVNFHGGGYAGAYLPNSTGHQCSYTPINNSYVTATGALQLQANPLYYGMVMFALAMSYNSSYGQMYPITLGLPVGDTTGPYLNGYAVQTGANSYSIVINNKYTEAYKATLTLPGSLVVQTTNIYQLLNTTAVPNETLSGAEAVLSDTTNSTQINGQTCGANGLFSPALSSSGYAANGATLYVPALSTVVFQITTTGTI